MRSLTASFALAILTVSASLAYAQSSQPAEKTSAPASNVASQEEVNQLRGEVAAQRKSIEELKALVEKLAGEKQPAATNGAAQVRPVSGAPTVPEQPVSARSENFPTLRNAVLIEAEPGSMVLGQNAAAAPKKDAPLTAGWNGEHFFIRSADGQFTISPYGYVDNDYRAYKGDGAPADTFVLRRARFGFQGSYGSHFDFALAHRRGLNHRLGRARCLSQRQNSAGVSIPGRPVQGTVRSGSRNRRHKLGLRRTRLSGDVVPLGSLGLS